MPIIISSARGCFSAFMAFNQFLSGFAKILVAIILAINLSIVFAGVIFRYVLGQPLGWVYEIAVFLMMWSAFVGSSTLSREKAHVALDLIVLKFPHRLRYLVQLFLELLVIIFLIIIIDSSLTMIQGLMASRSAYLRIPMYWVFSSVPIGMGMVLSQQIEHFINSCIGFFKVESV